MTYEKDKELLKSKTKFSEEDLRLIVEILRSEEGCPWDREQTHKSVVKGLIEETYEAVEAIEKENSEMLVEELGDILLQVIFHCRIGEENGSFDFEDVTTAVCKKMITRHPHVFGNAKIENTSEVLDNWERIKAETKKNEGISDDLSSIAVTLPALMRVDKIIGKLKKNRINSKKFLFCSNMGQEENFFGRKLWLLVLRCRDAGIDPESALRRYSDNVIRSVKSEK